MMNKNNHKEKKNILFLSIPSYYYDIKSISKYIFLCHFLFKLIFLTFLTDTAVKNELGYSRAIAFNAISMSR